MQSFYRSAALMLLLASVVAAKEGESKKGSSDAKNSGATEVAAVTPPAAQPPKQQPKTATAPTSVRPSNQSIAAELESKERLFTGQIVTGFYDGFGIHASGTFANFAENFPFRLRLGLGHSETRIGDAWAARRIFIDNNTNGDARADATVWDLRLDVLYPVKLFNLHRTMFFAGPRHADYSVFYEYIGGAETFNVISSHWGIGAGVETAFAISRRVDLVVSAGGDYYFRGVLSGHDTYYNPNGDHTNPIANYGYEDADAAIDQPDVMTRVMTGIAYRF